MVSFSFFRSLFILYKYIAVDRILFPQNLHFGFFLRAPAIYDLANCLCGHTFFLHISHSNRSSISGEKANENDNHLHEVHEQGQMLTIKLSYDNECH